MSDSQTVWTILWNRALKGVRPGEPFEIAEVIPEVAAALHVGVQEASHKVALVLSELSRLPEGRRFFALEGSAVVPLPEFLESSRGAPAPVSVYPYEL
jgi:hypothetical protein